MKEFCFSWILVLLFFPVFGKQIEVCSSCEVSTIREAVQKAEDGDEIVILEGVYKEHDIEVSKSLHFRGQGKAVIDGENMAPFSRSLPTNSV